MVAALPLLGCSGTLVSGLGDGPNCGFLWLVMGPDGGYQVDILSQLIIPVFVMNLCRAQSKFDNRPKSEHSVAGFRLRSLVQGEGLVESFLA